MRLLRPPNVDILDDGSDSSAGNRSTTTGAFSTYRNPFGQTSIGRISERK